MSCFYCDKIAATDPAYVTAAAASDLGLDAPRVRAALAVGVRRDQGTL